MNHRMIEKYFYVIVDIEDNNQNFVGIFLLTAYLKETKNWTF